MAMREKEVNVVHVVTKRDEVTFFFTFFHYICSHHRRDKFLKKTKWHLVGNRLTSILKIFPLNIRKYYLRHPQFPARIDLLVSTRTCQQHPHCPPHYPPHYPPHFHNHHHHFHRRRRLHPPVQLFSQLNSGMLSQVVWT